MGQAYGISALPPGRLSVPLPITSVQRKPSLRKSSIALEGAKWNRGCLIGDFSPEASLQSRLLRRRLEEIFCEWRTPFAQCIAEAQAAGEIDSKFEPVDLAEFLLASWEGAILRMKVERGPAALDRFKNIIFEAVFRNGEQKNKSEE
jgi:TetR/AcrR family transcriptional repressor of nem operon